MKNGGKFMTVMGKNVFVSRQFAEELEEAGVDLLDSFSDCRSRGLNKVYSLCRVTTPDGSVRLVLNMKKFVAETFFETYGYVMDEMKKPLGYKGYHSERLFFVSVSTVPELFSAVPLEHPEEYPVIQSARLETT